MGSVRDSVVKYSAENNRGKRHPTLTSSFYECTQGAFAQTCEDTLVFNTQTHKRIEKERKNNMPSDCHISVNFIIWNILATLNTTV